MPTGMGAVQLTHFHADFEIRTELGLSNYFIPLQRIDGEKVIKRDMVNSVNEAIFWDEGMFL